MIDREKRSHADRLEAGLVENLDLDAELAQRLAAAGEFLGIEHIRRLVHEIAREVDAVDRRRDRVAFRGVRRDTAADGERDLPGILLIGLFFGLVALEFIGGKPCSQSEI